MQLETVTTKQSTLQFRKKCSSMFLEYRLLSPPSSIIIVIMIIINVFGIQDYRFSLTFTISVIKFMPMIK